MKEFQPKYVLDIGCGSGQWLDEYGNHTPNRKVSPVQWNKHYEVLHEINDIKDEEEEIRSLEPCVPFDCFGHQYRARFRITPAGEGTVDLLPRTRVNHINTGSCTPPNRLYNIVKG